MLTGHVQALFTILRLDYSEPFTSQQCSGDRAGPGVVFNYQNGFLARCRHGHVVCPPEAARTIAVVAEER
jgi:hypothetical protein